jgi:polysaccharide biosynthesis/export protein
MTNFKLDGQPRLLSANGWTGRSLSLLVSTIVTSGVAQLPLSAQTAPNQPLPAQNSSVTLAPKPVPRLPPAAPDSSGYVIGAGDQVQMGVYGYEEYTRTLLVLPDGTINLPIIGTITVTGKTTTQLAQFITTELSNYLVDPVVTVSLVNLRPITVTVAGEVQRPGPLQLRGTAVTGGAIANADQTPTLSVALLQAGGVTRVADIRKVVLKRSQPNGETTTTTINLLDALQSDVGFVNKVLQDGDTIFIPKLAADEMIDRRLIARSSFSPTTVRVRVVGEVKAPGQVQVPPDSTLSSAVAIAGGPTDKAQLKQVTLVRLNEAGEVQKQTIDMRNLVDNVQVQDGDVVLVPKSGKHNIIDFLTPLLNPLGFFTNLIR